MVSMASKGLMERCQKLIFYIILFNKNSLCGDECNPYCDQTTIKLFYQLLFCVGPAPADINASSPFVGPALSCTSATQSAGEFAQSVQNRISH